jgi:hypothetical protein
VQQKNYRKIIKILVFRYKLYYNYFMENKYKNIAVNVKNNGQEESKAEIYDKITETLRNINQTVSVANISLREAYPLTVVPSMGVTGVAGYCLGTLLSGGNPDVAKLCGGLGAAAGAFTPAVLWELLELLENALGKITERVAGKAKVLQNQNIEREIQ